METPKVRKFDEDLARRMLAKDKNWREIAEAMGGEPEWARSMASKRGIRMTVDQRKMHLARGGRMRAKNLNNNKEKRLRMPFDAALVERMLAEGQTWRQIGEAFGKSETHARRTAARYGIVMTDEHRRAAREARMKNRDANMPLGKTLTKIYRAADVDSDERIRRAAMAKFSADLLAALVKSVRNGAQGAPMPLVRMAHEQIKQEWAR